MLGRRPSRSRSAVLTRWWRRLRWLRRAAIAAPLVAVGVRTAMRKRGGGTGDHGPGGSGRPVPSGDPSPRPHLSAVRAASTARAGSEVTTPVSVAAPTRDWVDGGDGRTVPEGFPVKAKASSGIYHEPGGRNYDRTRADRWYRSAAAAEADGFRAPKTA